MKGLAVRLSEVEESTEEGEWLRHVSVTQVARALEGSTRMGRWGTSGAYPVLYLGRPRDSVVVEAYRHLVDPVEVDSDNERATFMRSLMPRNLVSCSVSVTNLLDLRAPLARAQAGLTMQDLTSATTDSEAYTRCQEVSQAAHQLRRHGIIAPAATGLGDTLALFMDLLPQREVPQRSRPDESWQYLPDDPRITRKPMLRLVQNRE